MVVRSLKCKHVDVVEGKVVQDAREVRTKFSKTFTTWFFPLGEDVRRIAVLPSPISRCETEPLKIADCRSQLAQ